MRNKTNKKLRYQLHGFTISLSRHEQASLNILAHDGIKLLYYEH